ncbi:MAG: phytanoyl-CoA dioxygenase [Chromatiales bacterium]|jgi:hypothetical protein|nr:phytanoyl-CoA dioxygenase [Chromatiales bacterium]
MSEHYFRDGERRAMQLGNRGPLEFDATGSLLASIVEAYERTGFYVFEGVLSGTELVELVHEFEAVLERAPAGTGATNDRLGRPAAGLGFARPSFKFVKPLSDPNGGTASTHGRYPAKMAEPQVPAEAPTEVIYQLKGILQLMDSALRLYGHPGLLAVAERINGADFVPFTDTIWVKPAGLGASVSWHQDGTSHWSNPALDAGTHGFNFMAQLYDTNAENALWVMPGTHGEGKIDIRARMAANEGSDRLPGAVPMLAKAGDIAICNRQVLHGSFANTSKAPRATFVFGFHRRSSVLGVKGWDQAPYDAQWIDRRSRIIALAADARKQTYRDEKSYVYAPLAHELKDLHWSSDARETMLRNYNQFDIGI